MQTTKLSYLHAMGIQPWQLKTQSQPSCDSLTASDWDELRASVKNITTSRSVFGVGNQNADLMIIGDAPTLDDEKQGEPLVGRPGQLLTAMLNSIGLDRPSVYITTLFKCREPVSEKIESWLNLLEKQIALIQPKLLLVLGQNTAHYLLNNTLTLDQLRGKIHLLNNTPLVVTYHPAHLLSTPLDKSNALCDLQLTYKTLQTLNKI